MGLNNKRRCAEKSIEVHTKQSSIKQFKTSRVAPRYGLDSNGIPYDNPRYKFYANGKVDGNYWMCVHKPSGTVFPVSFLEPESKVLLSQHVYNTFSDVTIENDYNVVEKEEYEEGDSTQFNASNVLMEMSSGSFHHRAPIFESLFVGLQEEIGSKAKQNLLNEFINANAMFDQFHILDANLQHKVAKLVLSDIDPSTLAYAIVYHRLDALCDIPLTHSSSSP